MRSVPGSPAPRPSTRGYGIALSRFLMIYSLFLFTQVDLHSFCNVLSLMYLSFAGDKGEIPRGRRIHDRNQECGSPSVRERDTAAYSGTSPTIFLELPLSA